MFLLVIVVIINDKIVWDVDVLLWGNLIAHVIVAIYMENIQQKCLNVALKITFFPGMITIRSTLEGECL